MESLKVIFIMLKHYKSNFIVINNNKLQYNLFSFSLFNFKYKNSVPSLFHSDKVNNTY